MSKRTPDRFWRGWQRAHKYDQPKKGKGSYRRKKKFGKSWD